MAEHEHKGHRERLREKVRLGACCEHEYLEMFLCYAIPRRNTNDIAHRLLSKFGCLPKVLTAPTEALMLVDGVGETVATLLKCMGKFCEDYVNLFQSANALPQVSERVEFLSFINRTYPELDREVLDVYLIDANNNVFRRERFSSQREKAVQVETEAFTSLLVNARPSGIILVHNHPFGDPEPSSQDDETTKQCAWICSAQNVVLCNHYIYASRGIYDYYGSGKLKDLSKTTLGVLNTGAGARKYGEKSE